MKALVRCRKWVRARGCVSREVYSQIQSTIEHLQNTRNAIEKSMRQQQTNLRAIKNYDIKRVKAYEETFSNFVDDMRVVGKAMRDYVERLMKMNTYLQERSAVEKAYAMSLKTLATKWMDAGEKEKAKGFFHVVNRASLTVGENLDEFASLLTDGLCKGKLQLLLLLLFIVIYIRIYIYMCVCALVSDGIRLIVSCIYLTRLCIPDVQELLVEASTTASACLSEGPRLM